MAMTTTIPWKTLNWHRATKDIAEETRRSPSHVNRMRQRYGKPYYDYIFDWSKVDWSMTTNELAHRLGYCVTWTSTMRARYAPETLKKRRQRKKS